MTANKKFLFSETNLDRATNIRGNPVELNRLIKNPKTIHIFLWRGKILFDFSSHKPRLGIIRYDDKFWDNFDTIDIKQGNFIGFQDSAIFYHNIPDWDELEVTKLKEVRFLDDSRNYHPLLPNYYAFCEIRSLMTIISTSDAKILASVKGIYEWNKANSYCNKCGAETISTLSGWEKICKSCKAKHFPRTDPVVIMMIYRQDMALLGRSSIWPKGMFSCLAGFMEPGESIEAAVARETFEETGVLVQNTRYVTSQPWPFPASLMIGCLAEAKSFNISIDKNELEDARWFSKGEIRKAITSKHCWWPAREGSIARFLIEQWVDKKI